MERLKSQLATLQSMKQQVIEHWHRISDDCEAAAEVMEITSGSVHWRVLDKHVGFGLKSNGEPTLVGGSCAVLTNAPRNPLMLAYLINRLSSIKSSDVEDVALEML